MKPVQLQLADLSGGSDIVDAFRLPFRNLQVLEAAYIIQSDLCFNDGHKFTVLCPIDKTQVYDSLIAYIAFMVENPNVPMYDDNGDKTIKATIAAAVAKKASQNQNLVERILKDLYWATKQNRIKSTAILYPRESKLAKDYDQNEIVGPVVKAGTKLFDATGKLVVDTADGIGQTVKGIGSILQYLPYILLVGGIAAGAYYGNQFYQTFKGKK